MRTTRVGLGVDIGGTFTKIVAATREGKVLGRAQTPTWASRGPRGFVPRLAKALRRLERGLGLRAEAVGVGAAGDVDPERGIIRFSPNMRSFDRYPLRDALAAALRRRVSLHNDANMAAWGGYAVEFSRMKENLAAFTMGTGIGGGLVLGGRLFLGATGSAGEFGHMRIARGGENCRCGARGCLEAYAGRYAVVRSARRLLREYPRRKCPLRELARRPDFDASQVADAARAGDPSALEIWRGVGRAMAAGIANVVLAFNPDVVLVAGGVARAAPLFLPETRRLLRKESFLTPFRHVRVLAAKTEDLGAVGAAVYPLERAAAKGPPSLERGLFPIAKRAVRA